MFAPSESLVTFVDARYNSWEDDLGICMQAAPTNPYQPTSLTIPRYIFQTISEKTHPAPSMKNNIAPYSKISVDLRIMDYNEEPILKGMEDTEDPLVSVSQKDSDATDANVHYHMPHWNYYACTPSQQRNFISKYFFNIIGCFLII